MNKVVVVKMELKHVALLLWILQSGHPVWDEFNEIYGDKKCT